MSVNIIPTLEQTEDITQGALNIVKDALGNKQNTLIFDNAPTQNSANPVKSGGIYTSLSVKQDIIQVTTMPTASSKYVDKVFQYVGASNNNYVRGYFYRCVNVSDTYSWVNINVQNVGAYLHITDLGTEYTAELKNDISSGKFEKAVVGGKLTINGHVYYFAHPDYWLHCGDTECTTHHMVVVPAGNLATGKMNETNITTGGYVNSFMKAGKDEEVDGSTVHTDGALKTAADIIKADFGASNILTHRQLFSNAVTDGVASGWAWYNSDIDLMNESMVYGSPVAGKPISTSVNFNVGIDKSQLKLFAERPDLITNRSGWWLRDVVSSALFAYVDYGGYANNAGASYVGGVRPAFAIC